MNNDWIIWNGGDCPVAPDTMVQVQFRCDTRIGAEGRTWSKAKDWDWRADERPLDIIAYRIIPEPLWAEITGYAEDYGSTCSMGFTSLRYPRDTHRIRIPVKIINGKRVIDDSRQPVMEKL